MQPSIFTSFDRTVPFPEALAMIREAGFETVALDGCPGYSGYGTAVGRMELRRLLADNGLRVRAMHAPFPEGDRLFSLEEDQRLESVRQCRMGIETAAEFAAGAMALHLIPYNITDPDTENRMIAQGRRSLDALTEHARSLGVQLALENGQQAGYDRVLELLLEQYDPSVVGFCYDTGHEHVQGRCFHLLEKHAARLLCLHVHDNCGTDAHMLPYDGTIDWDRFRGILHGLAFPGDLLLECHPAQSSAKEPRAFLQEAMRRARRLLAPPVP